ncbi:hypothetical protein [Budvicia aquatica]|nr:hypothetical protein [Budvicia aquatica]
MMTITAEEQTQLTRLTQKGEGLLCDRLIIFMAEALERWEQFIGERPKQFSFVLMGYNPPPKVEFAKGGEISNLLTQIPSDRERRIFHSYLIWHRHPLLSSYLNPFEPIINLIHHQGTWERPENHILPIIDYTGHYGAIYPNYRLPHQ